MNRVLFQRTPTVLALVILGDVLIGASPARAGLINPMQGEHTRVTMSASIELTLPFDQPSLFVFLGGCDGNLGLTCWGVSVEIDDLIGLPGRFDDLRVIATHLEGHDEDRNQLRAFIPNIMPGFGHPAYRATFADYPDHRDWLQLYLYPLVPGVSSRLTIRTDRTGHNEFPPILPDVPEPTTVVLVGSGLVGLIYRRHRTGSKRRQ